MSTATMDTTDEGVARCEVVGGDGMCRVGGRYVWEIERARGGPPRKPRKHADEGVEAWLRYVSMMLSDSDAVGLKAGHRFNTRRLSSITT